MPTTGRQRSGKWIARIGVGALLFGAAACVRVLLSIVFLGFKASGVYKEALARARSSPEVRRELGEPVRPGWWVNGSMRVTGPSGATRFVTPLYGPIGHATLHVQAQKTLGRWNYDILEVAVDGRSERIDLLGSAAEGHDRRRTDALCDRRGSLLH